MTSPSVQPRMFHPDDTTPIPRPRITMAADTNSMADLLGKDQAQQMLRPAPPLSPADTGSLPAKIDKSLLAIAEPKRLRDKAHLKFVASQPCLSADANLPIRITCVLRNREQSALRSAMNSRCRSAVAIIGNCIKPAMRWPGGRISRLTRWRSLRDIWEQTHRTSVAVFERNF